MFRSKYNFQQKKWEENEVIYEGIFECSQFNCSGCDEGMVDGEQPKRNIEFILVSLIEIHD